MALLIVFFGSPLWAHGLPKKIAVANGIYLFMTPGYGDVGYDGNSIVIVSQDGVLVFDANGTPAAAEAVLAEIRRITDLSVRYLVISHWHWDHWYGAEVYKKAFPDIRIISQEKERAMMMGPELEFNKDGLNTALPNYIASLEKKAAAQEAMSPQPGGLTKLKDLVAEDRFFLEQKTGIHRTYPNVTYSNEMDIYMGERHIKVLHYDRAVTPGNSFLYLPDEKIIVAGDLLVNPITWTLSSYPTGWLNTLEKMDALNASVIIPGHGAPLRDKELLHATMEVFRECLKKGAEAKAQGLTVVQAKASILPGLRDLMVKITKDDPDLNREFATQLVGWFLYRVYDELNGLLTDAIAPIPKTG
ncbi:MAG TPA: MBL fold metallo-hydrolase [Terriglobales bacterium]|nr:MBL fold metallo-hydrolase [Terriglobales bacterium]